MSLCYQTWAGHDAINFVACILLAVTHLLDTVVVNIVVLYLLLSA